MLEGGDRIYTQGMGLELGPARATQSIRPGPFYLPPIFRAAHSK